MELSGCGALVTGGARRIGGAIATALAQEGARVAIHYRGSQEAAEARVAEIEEAGGTAVAVRGSLDSAAEAEALFASAVEAVGPIHVLVNNASTFRRSDITSPVDSLVEDWGVHVEAPWALSRALAHQLPESAEGQISEGQILNILDWRATIPDPQYVTYCVAKGGLHALTLTLARALGPRIRVNAVSPGAILPLEVSGESAPSGPNPADALRDLPIPRMGEVDDIVRASLFLIRDADYTTGTVIPVDGGRHLL